MPLANAALSQVQEKLQYAVASLGDPHLIRAVVSPPRIKSAASLERKAIQRGWRVHDSPKRATDLVGLRVVCNNLQDVRRVATLLEQALAKDGIRTKQDDYIARPTKDGYRSLHLLFRVPVPVENDTAHVGCEIQLRSRLQDSWAELSRADLYTPDTPIPVSIRRRMTALSTLLSRADGIAERIRRDLVRPRRGRRPQSGQFLTESAIAFLYRNRFGDAPPDYLVRMVSHETEAARLRADGLELALQDDALVERLEDAFEDASGYPAEPTQVFGWIASSLVVGTEAAVRRAARDGRTVRSEIESIGRREALSDVTSADDIVDSLEHAQKDEDPESDIERWAQGLGVANDCAFCGTTIVDPDEFADAVVSHFKLRGKKAERRREELVDAVRSSAVEQGSWGSSSVCSHCDGVISKDD